MSSKNQNSKDNVEQKVNNLPDDDGEFQVQLLEKGAKIPTRSHEGDVGYDLYALEKTIIPFGGHSVKVRTGIAITPPKGYFGKIEEKSGLALKRGISTRGGIIDKKYTGEVIVVLANNGGSKKNDFDTTVKKVYEYYSDNTLIDYPSHNPNRNPIICAYYDHIFEAGDKIAQLVFYRVKTPKPKVVKKLNINKGTRGSDGFGSTGKK